MTPPPLDRSFRDLVLLALPIALLGLALIAAIDAALDARAGAENMGKWPSSTAIPAIPVNTSDP